MTNTKHTLDLKKAREEATKRFLIIADTLKKEAGVTGHKITKTLSGRAFSDGTIKAPEGRTRNQLYILARECGHIALKHSGSTKPKHRREFEAEKYAHNALRRHGVAVPRKMTARAKRYVRRKIDQALKCGAKKIDAEALAWGQA